MRLGYLTSKYPAVSHTFVQREITALRTLGVEIETFSVWAAGDADVLTDDDRRERDATYALLPPNVGDMLLAHLRALLTRPRGYARALGRAVALSTAGIRGRLLGLLWFAEAVVLWRECLRRDVRHLHVHINGTAPAVALVTTFLGNGGRAAGDWSWSFTAHGPSEFYDAWRERLGDKVEHAAFVVCISDFARSQVLTFADHEWWDKVHVVHCGVDVRVFEPDGDGRERSASDRGSPAEILSVGRLVPFKGQAVLVRAIAELARRGVPVRATLIGDGPARTQLESLARRLGVDGQITFTGAIGQDVIRRYYREADVFCMSSFAEGIPVVLM
ncbi:MAG: hypothetical protein QOJ12_2671, partial [Thermoleophilales bacterium]|nr:hypothetical protein [Thermoleophilales bacterium]